MKYRWEIKNKKQEILWEQIFNEHDPEDAIKKAESIANKTIHNDKDMGSGTYLFNVYFVETPLLGKVPFFTKKLVKK